MRKPDALAVASDGRFVPVVGDVLICQYDDSIIGSGGMGGDSLNNDEYPAIAAIRVAGLKSIGANSEQDEERIYSLYYERRFGNRHRPLDRRGWRGEFELVTVFRMVLLFCAQG